MNSRKLKKRLILLLPYIILGLACTNLGEAWRMAEGADFGNRLVSCFGMIAAAFGNPLPSLHPLDLALGTICGGGLRLAVFLRGKNAKHYRHNLPPQRRIRLRQVGNAEGHRALHGPGLPK